MIVVDASAVIDVLVGEPSETLASRLGAEPVLHAPHLVDTEVLHVLRRLEQRGDLTADQADRSRRMYAELGIARYPHWPLSDRVWELRPALSSYDATYVALAEDLGATLVTTDQRLGRAAGVRAPIEPH